MNRHRYSFLKDVFFLGERMKIVGLMGFQVRNLLFQGAPNFRCQPRLRGCQFYLPKRLAQGKSRRLLVIVLSKLFEDLFPTVWCSIGVSLKVETQCGNVGTSKRHQNAMIRRSISDTWHLQADSWAELSKCFGIWCHAFRNRWGLSCAKPADEKWIKMGRNFDVVIIPNWSSFTELFPSKASFNCGEGEVESDRGTHNGTTAATVWSPRVPCYLLVFWV